MDRLSPMVRVMCTYVSLPPFTMVSSPCSHNSPRVGYFTEFNRAGKTALLNSFLDNSFDSDPLTTIGIDFNHKIVQLCDGQSIRLQLWGTAGQERFRQLTPSYIRSSRVALLVIDLSAFLKSRLQSISTTQNKFDNFTEAKFEFQQIHKFSVNQPRPEDPKKCCA